MPDFWDGNTKQLAVFLFRKGGNAFFKSVTKLLRSFHGV